MFDIKYDNTWEIKSTLILCVTGALILLLFVVDTFRDKKKKHLIIKSIGLSFCSKSKNEFLFYRVLRKWKFGLVNIYLFIVK